MQFSILHETKLIFFWSLSALLISWIFNFSLYPFVFVFVAFLVYYLKNIKKLYDWLRQFPNRPVPEATGLWGDIFNELYSIQRNSGDTRQELSKMLLQFQNAAEALPDAMVILREDYLIEWANLAAKRLIGIKIPHDINQHISNILRHPSFQEYIKKAHYGTELKLPSPEKKNHTIHIQIIPYANKKLLMCRDITHVIRLEEMRSQFVANVSHEMRSPITVLLGYLETLPQLDLKSEECKEVIETMQEQAQRMERLLADLLSLSKLETNPLSHEREIDSCKIIGSALDAYKKIILDKNLQVKTQLDQILIIGNELEINSLFTNLINNAVRYTPEGGKINITSTLRREKAIFTIENTGPGIPAHHIPHLTKRFYRIDVDRSRDSGGTGLGLAIVKHILGRHDGFLEISSALNKQTRFICCFPIERIKKSGQFSLS